MAVTNTFGVVGIELDGTMGIDTAKSWIAGMNGTSYLGFKDWRLPISSPVNGSEFVFNPPTNNGSTTDTGFGFTSTNSELGNLYYSSLGNLGTWIPNGNGSPFSTETQDGSGLRNFGPFLHLDPVPYYIDVAVDPSSGYNLMFFNFINGLQDVMNGGNGGLRAWAVRDGDVSAVPLPSALWLFSSALGGLGIMRRRFG